MNETRKLQANIPKILFWNGARMFLVIMPVVVPFFQSHGLNMEQIFQLQSIFAISLAILEVPSGYIADLIGRKGALIVEGIFHGIAYSILLFSDSFLGFVCFELSIAIAVSLGSGTDVALLYDTMALMPDSKENESKVLGQKLFYSQTGETLAALLGGALAVYSLTLPALANAIIGWVPLFIVLSLYEPPRQLMSKQKHMENFRYIYRSLFRDSRLLRYIILNLIFYGLATLLAVWAFQGYWKAYDIPLSYFGYIWAAYNLTVALTARMAHDLERRFGAVALIIIIAILPVAGYLGMAYFSVWLGVISGFAFQFCRGLTQVIFRDALNKRVSGDMRATANSISSLGVRLSFAFIGPLMGYLIDHQGYSTAFYFFAGVFILVFFLVSLPLLKMRNSFQNAGG